MAMVAMTAAVLTAYRCGKSEESPVKPEEEPVAAGYNAHHSPCLLHTDAEAAKGFENPDSLGVEYRNGTLHVTHYNLMVNCGIAAMDGGIEVRVVREGSTITINELEDENAPMANCMCEVNNEFDISGVEPGTYTIVLNSWYPEPRSFTYTF